MTKNLAELVESLRDYQMSKEEAQRQKVSFVVGNSKLDKNTTVEDAEKAVNSEPIPKIVA